MGGLLFNTPRKNVKEFIDYRNKIETLLHFYQIEYKIPPYYRDKKSFGDLDILIKKTFPTSRLLLIFNNREHHYDKSESVISFNYKNFQIDFIKIEPEDFEIAYYYYSYNDLSNLIGQLAGINYLKFGFDGLKYEHVINGQYKGNIPISKNIDKILKFLDLDPVKYHSGFDSMEDMFNFITRSKYFNPYVSDLEPYGYDKKGVALYRLNKINRSRNEKRKTYQEWLNFSSRFKTGEKKFSFRGDLNKDEVFDKIDKFFPEAKFKEKINFFEEKEEERKLIKTKFNGNLIIKLLPDLKKEDRQLFIHMFQSFMEKKYSSFGNYVLKSDQSTIENDIIEFYSKFEFR